MHRLKKCSFYAIYYYICKEEKCLHKICVRTYGLTVWPMLLLWDDEISRVVLFILICFFFYIYMQRCVLTAASKWSIEEKLHMFAMYRAKKRNETKTLQNVSPHFLSFFIQIGWRLFWCPPIYSCLKMLKLDEQEKSQHVHRSCNDIHLILWVCETFSKERFSVCSYYQSAYVYSIQMPCTYTMCHVCSHVIIFNISIFSYL